ncbi:MAG: hypothetical protein JW783_07120 [Bacteroidales bacterium]|nr:hypothetical protein [Bacteroidales bacterium]MBN2748304.1 hypothetical protein [Bacteroidales bacterium]
MRINRGNYELFFIDYIEGNLSPNDSQELLLFLDLNPDLKEELEAISQTILVPPAATPGFNKQLLKKSEHDTLGIDNHDDYLCIAFLEGDLPASERAAFIKSVSKSKALSKRLEQHSAAKLIANSNTRYPSSQRLKRGALYILTPSITQFGVTLVAASAIGAILWFGNSYFVSTTQTEIQAITASKQAKEPVIKPGKEIPTMGAEAPQKHQPKTTSSARSNLPKAKEQEPETMAIQESLRANQITISTIAAISEFTITKAPLIESEPTINLKNLLPNSSSTTSTAPNTELIAMHQEESISLFRRVKDRANKVKSEVNKLISIDIKRDNEGIIEKVSIESKVFAFSTTRKKK